MGHLPAPFPTVASRASGVLTEGEPPG
jgi:hypothetical protein